MKKIIFLLFVFKFLISADLNMVIGKPIFSVYSTPIVQLAINKGFVMQVTDLTNRIKEKNIDIDIKYLNPEIYLYPNNPLFQKYKTADENAKVNIEDFIKKFNNDFSKEAQNTYTEKISLKGNINFATSINFSKSKLKKINQKTIKANNYDDMFKTILNRISSEYDCHNETCMAFYNKIRKGRKYYITKAYKEKPDIFFYENFSPYMKGRRYFLDIIIYVISVDDEGNPSFEYEVVKNFEWIRNYRFISAQTGHLIRELIANKTNKDIR